MVKRLDEFLKTEFVPVETDYHYAAALLDGEGHIGIYRSRPSGDAKTTGYTAVVSVEMADYEPVLFMRNLFGGHMSSRKRASNLKEVHVWTCCSRKAAHVIEKVLPYLKIGRKQRTSLACLELLKTSASTRSPKKLRTPPHVLARRETLYQICKECNRRG
jgi:hypothetical protein